MCTYRPIFDLVIFVKVLKIIHSCRILPLIKWINDLYFVLDWDYSICHQMLWIQLTHRTSHSMKASSCNSALIWIGVNLIGIAIIQFEGCHSIGAWSCMELYKWLEAVKWMLTLTSLWAQEFLNIFAWFYRLILYNIILQYKSVKTMKIV